jgi:hypothetical protein
MENKLISVKLNFEIQFKVDSKSHPEDFKSLINFFDNLNKVHTGIIRLCCEDYFKNTIQQLREEHKLRLTEIQYGKPLKIHLFLVCDVKTFYLYFSIIKEILKGCEIYAGSTDKARITIAGMQNAIIDLLKKINEKLPNILPNSKFDEIENEIKNGKIIRSLIEKIEDAKFKKSYNSLCNRSIFISKLNLFYNNIEETLIDKQ